MNDEEWISPDWSVGGRCHNWRNYISMRLVGIWDTFTEEQKFAIYENAEHQAENEEWE